VLFLAGCPSAASPDAPLGADVPALDGPALDGPALDGPALDGPALDAPAPDAPVGADVPAVPDAPPTPDAPAAPDAPDVSCLGLAAATCLLAGCVPSFDDSCCSSCTPGACADCTNIDWNGCRPFDDSPCTGGCGAAPTWVCRGSPARCDGAVVTDADSCTIAGCVPAVPSGSGEPDLGAAICVPITAETCTALCDGLPPRCPTGTAAEADGGCYTGRCVPAFVCLMR
jgi:hypothetical protein